MTDSHKHNLSVETVFVKCEKEMVCLKGDRYRQVFLDIKTKTFFTAVITENGTRTQSDGSGNVGRRGWGRNAQRNLLTLGSLCWYVPMSSVQLSDICIFGI
jgi:hypothetical protein